MNQQKLIKLVQENPQLWNRDHKDFRNQDWKIETWRKIAYELNVSEKLCRDTFKGLREKYLRLKSKDFVKWEHYAALKFLEPHIVPRRSIRINKTAESGFPLTVAENRKEKNFLKTLISLVHESKALWAHYSHDHGAKKQQWKRVAGELGVDVLLCMQKWKGLREKYIRERQKFHEGRQKWEFLDDMAFLDGVIGYRKRQLHGYETCSADSQLDPLASDCDLSDQDGGFCSENLGTPDIKSEELSDFSEEASFGPGSIPEGNGTSETTSEPPRKRPASPSCSMRERKCDHNKTPEQIFGEFVAASLAQKTEAGKNSAMVQIMAVLANTN